MKQYDIYCFLSLIYFERQPSKAQYFREGFYFNFPVFPLCLHTSFCVLSPVLNHMVRLSSLFWRRNDFRNDFQGDLGDDKRKAVLIMGLETPFRDAAFISTFSGVELRFPNDFQGDFCR